jgi:hypothetical protein
MESADLAARARRAYEVGRLRWALQIGWVVVALVAVSFVAAGRSRLSAATGVALLATATALRWRGRVWGAAVRAGVGAGMIPFALLLGLKCSAGYFCAFGGCLPHCVRFCGLGGLAAGVLLASHARRRDDDAAAFLIAGSAVAVLTGMLGCFVGGLAGIGWMILGELTATLPAYALELRRR